MLEFSSTESCSTGATSSPLSGFSSNVSSCDGNVALINDFESTEGCSSQGPQGPEGFSAYQIAVFNGFVGTEEEWLASLVGTPGANAPTYTRRSDFVTDTNYFGSALTGSSESANVWKIYKIVISSAGTTTKLSATNVAWTNRYSVIYS